MVRWLDRRQDERPEWQRAAWFGDMLHLTAEELTALGQKIEELAAIRFPCLPSPWSRCSSCTADPAEMGYLTAAGGLSAAPRRCPKQPFRQVVGLIDEQGTEISPRMAVQQSRDRLDRTHVPESEEYSRCNSVNLMLS